ncbi:pyridoxamine 5'-phosphate oxidase [Jiulongibacter sp. NS-SX5]|uniref:pyridoxamine 5'-phosphate oxidase n=1 Tax=Jiulongibacter sp. NS-SX5 TaxID=3463854 RepID=UPI004058A998
MTEKVGISENDQKLSDMRVNYTKGELLESEAGRDPFSLFEQWMKEAKESEVKEPNAFVLSTIKENRPSARVLLLKGLDETGFVFFTNYLSHKGEEMARNNVAAMTFFWDHMERQVRIEGDIEKVSEEESTSYFHSRPRGSQIGAWVSNQSSIIEGREKLEQKNEYLIAKFADTEIIPKPPYWGGYRLIPRSIEFWQGRPSRLHDRLLFCKKENEWSIDRLSP